jgi:hypothetical protein
MERYRTLPQNSLLSLFNKVFSVDAYQAATDSATSIADTMTMRDNKFGLGVFLSKKFPQPKDKCKAIIKNTGKRKIDEIAEKVVGGSSTPEREAMVAHLRDCFLHHPFLDLKAVFNNSPNAPMCLEVGSGAGEWAVAQVQ